MKKVSDTFFKRNSSAESPSFTIRTQKKNQGGLHLGFLLFKF